jgi:hypothetical protein
MTFFVGRFKRVCITRRNELKFLPVPVFFLSNSHGGTFFIRTRGAFGPTFHNDLMRFIVITQWRKANDENPPQG